MHWRIDNYSSFRISVAPWNLKSPATSDCTIIILIFNTFKSTLLSALVCINTLINISAHQMLPNRGICNEISSTYDGNVCLLPSSEFVFQKRIASWLSSPTLVLHYIYSTHRNFFLLFWSPSSFSDLCISVLGRKGVANFETVDKGKEKYGALFESKCSE